jgi:hypothetical protein
LIIASGFAPEALFFRRLGGNIVMFTFSEDFVDIADGIPLNAGTQDVDI